MRRSLSFSRRFSSAMRRAISGSDSASGGSNEGMACVLTRPSGGPQRQAPPAASRARASLDRAVLWLASMLPLVLAATAARRDGRRHGRPSGRLRTSTSPPRIRSGVVVGLALGAGLAGASGYPNNSSRDRRPRVLLGQRLHDGSSGSLFVMGALADYLNFGFWFGQRQLPERRLALIGGGGRPPPRGVPSRLRLSAAGWAGRCSDSSASAAPTSTSSDPEHPEASGTQSFLGSGIFYEWSFGSLFGGHFGVGPSLEYDAIWSRPFERTGWSRAGASSSTAARELVSFDA